MIWRSVLCCLYSSGSNLCIPGNFSLWFGEGDAETEEHATDDVCANFCEWLSLAYIHLEKPPGIDPSQVEWL